jgi:hypothetical protein
MSVWESYRGMYGGDQHPDVLTAVHNLGGKVRAPLLSGALAGCRGDWVDYALLCMSAADFSESCRHRTALQSWCIVTIS